MNEPFEYVSHSRVEYHHGYGHACLGEVPQPVVYGHAPPTSCTFEALADGVAYLALLGELLVFAARGFARVGLSSSAGVPWRRRTRDTLR
jgi:hypothetical protein